MKKRFFAILITLSFILAIALAPAVYAAGYDRVVDEASVLTDSEWLELVTRADAISEKHKCDVAIVAIDYFTDNDPVEAWAEFAFEECDYGWGADKSGILFFISVDDREMTLLAHGYGNVAFTDYGKDIMNDNFIVPLLRDDKFYEAFSVYLDKADEFLALARGGTPFDIDTDEEYLAAEAKKAFRGKLALAIILPLIISLIVCSVWRGQMKTARKAREADNYIPAGGFNLSRQEDTFLYTTQTRIKREKSESSGGSGRSGGTTTNSRGYSSSSRKF